MYEYIGLYDLCINLFTFVYVCLCLCVIPVGIFVYLPGSDNNLMLRWIIHCIHDEKKKRN